MSLLQKVRANVRIERGVEARDRHSLAAAYRRTPWRVRLLVLSGAIILGALITWLTGMGSPLLGAGAVLGGAVVLHILVEHMHTVRLGIILAGHLVLMAFASLLTAGYGTSAAANLSGAFFVGLGVTIAILYAVPRWAARRATVTYVLAFLAMDCLSGFGGAWLVEYWDQAWVLGPLAGVAVTLIMIRASESLLLAEPGDTSHLVESLRGFETYGAADAVLATDDEGHVSVITVVKADGVLSGDLTLDGESIAPLLAQAVETAARTARGALPVLALEGVSLSGKTYVPAVLRDCHGREVGVVPVITVRRAGDGLRAAISECTPEAWTDQQIKKTTARLVASTAKKGD